MRTITTTTYDYNEDGTVAKEVVVREEAKSSGIHSCACSSRGLCREHEAQDDLAAAIQRIQDLVNSDDWQVACPNIARQVQGAIDGREVSL